MRQLALVALVLMSICAMGMEEDGHPRPFLKLLRNKLIHPTMQVELNEPDICDPTVQQYSGYIDVNENKHYFFWFFESRSNPQTDDFILWLNGGPGCSSLMGPFTERLGPCDIAEDLSEVYNPYSWNNNASIIFVDAPVGAGFSYGTDFALNTKEYAQDLYAFFQLFFTEFPKYQKLNFHVFGESYAGHYIPAFGAEVVRGNQRVDAIQVNLQSVGIGNGMSDPLNQYPYYPKMACNNSYEIPVFGEGVCNTMEATMPLCLRLIEKCYNTDDRDACVNATVFCNLFMITPYKLVDVNPYNIRLPCEFPPLCYDFSRVSNYLQQTSVKRALGTTGRRWTECNYIVNILFQLVGYDWMRPVVDELALLVESNKIRVLLYAGDLDYIVHHYGVENLSLNLPWKFNQEFNSAATYTWLPGGEEGGRIRTYGPLTYLQVYEAGHMVPMDQPERSQIMLMNWIRNLPL